MDLDHTLRETLVPTLIRHDPSLQRQWRGPMAINNHLGRLVRAVLGSEMLPAFLRTRALAALGAKIDRTTCIWSGCDFRSTNFDFGPRVFINIGFFFDGVGRLTIEEDVRIGQFVRVLTASHEIGPTTQRCLLDVIAAPVRIERGSWIGACVIILPGVTIAQGSVIAAGSLVSNNTEPNGLYAGSPARRIKNLPITT